MNKAYEDIMKLNRTKEAILNRLGRVTTEADENECVEEFQRITREIRRVSQKSEYEKMLDTAGNRRTILVNLTREINQDNNTRTTLINQDNIVVALNTAIDEYHELIDVLEKELEA